MVTEDKIHISYFLTKLAKLLSLLFDLQNIAEKGILTYVFHFNFHLGDYFSNKMIILHRS